VTVTTQAGNAELAAKEANQLAVSTQKLTREEAIAFYKLKAEVRGTRDQGVPDRLRRGGVAGAPQRALMIRHRVGDGSEGERFCPDRRGRGALERFRLSL